MRRRSAAAVAAVHPATNIAFDLQWVMTASAENSSRGMSIRCSLFGDQKVSKVAVPERTDLTNEAYHHSSANGALTPLTRMKVRVRRAKKA